MRSIRLTTIVLAWAGGTFVAVDGSTGAQCPLPWTDPAPLNNNAETDAETDEQPRVTTDGAGNWVAVWHSSDELGLGLGTDGDILVVRSVDNGATWTDPAPLNNNADMDSGDDWHPQVTTDGVGNWVVVWRSEDPLDLGLQYDFDVFVARSVDNGATWTDPAPLNNNADMDSGDERNPQVTTDKAGTWVVVWNSNDDLGGTIGTDFDILVARSVDNGVTWTDPAPLNNNAGTDSGDDNVPHLTTDEAGHWLAVWGSHDTLGGTIGIDNDILVARSVDSGETWTDPAPLQNNDGPGGGDDRYPQITTDKAGTWVAVWHSDDSLGATIGTDFDILVARSMDNGETWTDSSPLNNNAATDSGDDGTWCPQVTTDGAGNWVVVWDSDDDLGSGLGSDRDIFVARSVNNGETWTDPAPLNNNATTDSGDDWYPAVSTDGGGNWVVVWQSDDDLGLGLGTDADIFAARVGGLTSPSDCNSNGFPDDCDISAGISGDCNVNDVPDECDIAVGTSGDCNNNDVPDECELAAGTAEDCNGNGLLDECDLAAGTEQDCNGNLRPDSCDMSDGTSDDCNVNGVPDDCDVAPTLMFTDADDLLSGVKPVAVAVGDLNGDDLPDLAIANRNDDDVTLLFNNGDETFSPGGVVAVDAQPQAVVAMDFNGDDDNDLITVNEGGNVSVLLNAGGGVFGAATQYPAGLTPTGVASGDFDGVNGPDVAVSNRMSNDVSVLLNNGDGTFGSAVAYAVGQAASALTTADIDNDGDLDLAVTNETDETVSILANNGDGMFAGQVVYALPAGEAPFAIQAADINGNTRLDLIVGVSNGIAILRNAGLNGFIYSHTVPARMAYYLTATDLDGDGDVDVATTDLLGTTVEVLRNRGDATFLAAAEFDVGSEPAGLVAADMNNDGLPELAVANRADNSASVLWNASIPALSNDCNDNGVPDYCDDNALFAHDCNGNDIPDECEPDCNGNRIADECDLSRGTSEDCNGNGLPDECDLSPVEFSWPTYYDLAGAGGNATVVAADFDRDGAIDLAASSGGSRYVSVYLNEGQGQFFDPVHHTTPTAPGVLAVGDLNGDNAPDLVVSTTDGAGPVGVLLNNGNGMFPAETTDYAVGYRSHSVALADLDGDDDLDVAVACYYLSNEGIIRVMMNKGDGTFIVPDTDYGVGQSPVSIAAGDLNGDELPDLAVANKYDNNVSVLFNTGGAVFVPGGSHNVGSAPVHVAMYDPEGDDDLDLVVAEEAGLSISLLVNTGAGTFDPAVTYPIGGEASWTAFGDLDGDDLPDLAVVNRAVNGVSFLLNQGGGDFALAGSVVLYNWPIGGGGAYAMVLADVDADSEIDLVVTNSGGVDVAVLLNESVAAIDTDCNDNGVPDECEADTDSDGVPDDCDLCPGTVPNVPVNAFGCPDPAIPNDYDNDGDVDQYDHDAFEACASGSAVPLTPGCEEKDRDTDGDVDQSDFAEFQRCYSGEDNPGDPTCAD